MRLLYNNYQTRIIIRNENVISVQQQ